MKSSTYCLLCAAMGTIGVFVVPEPNSYRTTVAIFLAAFYVCRAIESGKAGLCREGE